MVKGQGHSNTICQIGNLGGGFSHAGHTLEKHHSYSLLDPLVTFSRSRFDWARFNVPQYRLYRGRFLQVIWPNQQYQSTEGNQLVFQIRLESHQGHSTMLQ